MNNNGIAQFSIIIPLYNEEGNVAILHKELTSVLKGYDFELIYVNDGSTDATYLELKNEISISSAPCTKIINLSKNFGQSFALKKGLANARYPITIFMDGDLQIDPCDIPRLVAKINEGFDFVQGVRDKRKDPFFRKVLPAAMANLVLRITCGSKFKDIGCSLKAFRREFILDIAFQRGTHRMLPLYLMLQGTKFTEIRVNHRKRIFGKTKYGMSRIFEVVIEIIRILEYRLKTYKFK